MHKRLLLVVAALAFLSVSTAHAGLITYNFSGALASKMGTLPLGTPYHGDVSLDTSQPLDPFNVYPQDPTTTNAWYNYASLHLDVGGDVWDVPGGRILMGDNMSNFGDLVDIEFDGGTFGGQAVSHGRLRLQNHEGTAISSLSLPFTDDLRAWPWSDLFLYYFPPEGGVIGFSAPVKTLSVPDLGSSLLLFGMGLAGLGAVRRRMRE